MKKVTLKILTLLFITSIISLADYKDPILGKYFLADLKAVSASNESYSSNFNNIKLGILQLNLSIEENGVLIASMIEKGDEQTAEGNWNEENGEYFFSIPGESIKQNVIYDSSKDILIIQDFDEYNEGYELIFKKKNFDDKNDVNDREV